MNWAPAISEMRWIFGSPQSALAVSSCGTYIASQSLINQQDTEKSNVTDRFMKSTLNYLLTLRSIKEIAWTVTAATPFWLEVCRNYEHSTTMHRDLYAISGNPAKRIFQSLLQANKHDRQVESYRFFSCSSGWNPGD